MVERGFGQPFEDGDDLVGVSLIARFGKERHQR